MCFWIVALKSIGSVIGFYRIDKNVIRLPFTKFDDRITNTCMIKHVANSRLKDFFLNSPSARPKFFQALVQIKVYYHYLRGPFTRRLPLLRRAAQIPYRIQNKAVGRIIVIIGPPPQLSGR